MKKKQYQIFYKEKCIYKCLHEDEFEKTWEMINQFISASGAVEKTDLRFIEKSD